MSAGLSGGVGGNVHFLHSKILNTRPPDPHGANAVVWLPSMRIEVVCEQRSVYAIATRCFTSPMPKAAQVIKIK